MDLLDTESFCSNSSSDINLPKDYSLSSSDISMKCEVIETNNNTISKSMLLNFGVERLLSKCDKKFDRNHIIDEMLTNRNAIDKNLLTPSANDHEVLLNLSANNVHNQPEIGSNQLGINLLHQQLTHINNGLLSNQNFVLKPFPIRFGRNHNGENLIIFNLFYCLTLIFQITFKSIKYRSNLILQQTRFNSICFMSLVRKSIFKQIAGNLYDFLDRVKVYKFISAHERVFPYVEN